MKQVMDSFGKFILEAIVLIIFIALLFTSVTDDSGNKGILNIIGAQLQTGGTDYYSYADFNVYETESKKEAPVISYNGAGTTLYTGSIILSDYIKAVDQTGNEIPVKVLSIRNQDDIELIDTYNPDTTEIILSQPGIYTIKLSAVDAINKKTVGRFHLPVNQ